MVSDEPIECKSASYESCGCGSDCMYLDLEQNTEATPCWGKVEAADEIDWGDGDYCWVHACEGHYAVYNSEPYLAETDKPKPIHATADEATRKRYGLPERPKEWGE